MDEIGTNLHPSMMQQFLDVVQDVFIKEYGLKIFLVTHSPSTVALVPDDSIFVMRKKEEDGPRIERVGKSEALNVLSEGYVSITEEDSASELQYRLQKEEGESVLFVEGVTDQIILEAAWAKLCPEKDMPFSIQNRYDADGVKNPFIRGEIYAKNPNHTFVGVLDFDRKGLECWEKIKGRGEYKIVDGDKYILKHKKQKGYCICCQFQMTGKNMRILVNQYPA